MTTLYEQVVEGLLVEMAIGAGTLTRVVSALAGADADPDPGRDPL